ncbi:primosomal protein N' [bacterium]|nr:primosomal protein N' [bacterium]
MPGDPLIYTPPRAGWPELDVCPDVLARRDQPSAGNTVSNDARVSSTAADHHTLHGRRVLVPLSNRSRVGVIVPPPRTLQTPLEPGKLRPVDALLDRDSAVLPPELISLSAHVVKRYLASWGEVIQAALPNGLLDPPDIITRWIGPELEGQWPREVTSSRSHSTLSRYLAGEGTLSAAALRRKFPRLPVDAILLDLAAWELIEREERLADAESSATTDWVIVNADTSLDDIPARASARRRLFETLQREGGEAPWTDLKDLANVSRSVLNALVEAGQVRIEERTKDVIGLGFDPRTPEGTPPPLTGEQTAAVAEVAKRMDSGEREVFLLDGLPGTGKTRVYVELIRKARELGKGVLVLVPEISLTPQVVARIRQVLHEPVVVLHSGLSRGSRLAAWRALHRGEAKIAVGARSAVFAPVHDLGLVIVDEEHEEAYKQQGPAPRYHGRDLAAVRGWMANAPVVLASATPSLETMHLVNERKRAIRLPLTQRFGANWPEIKVVDRRREAEDAPYVGPQLADAIRSHTRNGGGVILLITRRGYAPVLQCNNCGETLGCPNCDIPLTYHARGARRGEPDLRCHICGYSKRVPDTCGQCASDDLRAFGMGTQRIEEEIAERFPELVPSRMDRDTLRKVGEQERLLRAFAGGESQVLLGTQLVAKGHDFAHVTLVGVINADPSLNQPDFRAAERTYRLLIQAAGRAGRGEKPGEVIIQTLRPEHSLFGYLAKPSRDAFTQMELDRRALLDYPPFAQMALLTFSGNDEERVRSSALRAADYLGHHPGPLQILGPEPAFIKRVKRKYRWRLMVRVSKTVDASGEQMRAVLRTMLTAVMHDSGVRVSVDVDPVEVS